MPGFESLGRFSRDLVWKLWVTNRFRSYGLLTVEAVRNFGREAVFQAARLLMGPEHFLIHESYLDEKIALMLI